MLRKVLIGAGIAVAGIVIAQIVSVQGAVGRGAVANEAGGRGKFQMEVKKATNANNETRIDGNFKFERIAENAGDRFAINGKPRELAVNGNVCEFAGPAVLTRRGPNGQPIRIEGRLVVRVQDNRNPNSPPNTDRDKMRWKFVRANSTDEITYEGTVRDGDLKVFTRP